ncbi:MAG: hypothetical protein HQL71_07820 [Magnetococcales bacterium]|nr:hypothetical protein [Magnetococcales bacterium]
MEIDKKLLRLWINDYFRLVEKLSSRNKWKDSQIIISGVALEKAFREVKIDFEFMLERRKPVNGISESKLAGIIAFRLSRFHPIHLGEKYAEKADVLEINNIVAFAFPLFFVFKKYSLTNLPDDMKREFLYILSRRHTNQESLGHAYSVMLRYLTISPK